MKVKDLIKILSNLHPEMEIYREYDSMFSKLEDDDVRVMEKVIHDEEVPDYEQVLVRPGKRKVYWHSEPYKKTVLSLCIGDVMYWDEPEPF